MLPLYGLADRIDAEMDALPKGADGVPIHVGDMVYDGDGCGHTVMGIVHKAAVWRVIVPLCECDKSIELTSYLTPSELTHRHLDSWERIAQDIETFVTLSDVDDTQFRHDIADRIRKLAEKEGE